MVGRNFFAKYKSGTLLGIYVLFSFFSLALSTKSITLKPKEIGLSFFSIFQQGGSAIGTFFAETVTSIRTLGELKQDYAAALEKLKQYERIEKDFHGLTEENRQLKEVLGFSQGLEYKNIPAKIIGKDPQNYHATLTVNKGSLAGVRKNMPVIAIQGGKQGLVGKIAQAGLNASIIQPLYDPTAFVAARLLTSRYEGLVSGSGDESVKMRYVKRYARSNIRYGDIVVTSGMKSLYPSGIVIGTIKAILARDYDTSLELEIEPIIDFNRLEYLYILAVEGKE
jgi:rod shape-determining protein MreC